MLGFGSLWWVVLVAAVAVWIVSALAWMVLPHHRSDFKKLPDEEAARAALGGDLAAGEYMVPHCTMETAKDPDLQQKHAEGPNAVVMVWPRGAMNMGKSLGLWLAYTVLVSFFTAYITRHAVPAGAGFKQVMQVAGAIAIGIYALQPIPLSIWKPQPWATALKSVLDGVAYGVVTGAVFGLAWPS